MLICVSRRVVVGAAATAGVFHAQPLKEHGRDASASVEESASEVLRA